MIGFNYFVCKSTQKNEERRMKNEEFAAAGENFSILNSQLSIILRIFAADYILGL